MEMNSGYQEIVFNDLKPVILLGGSFQTLEKASECSGMLSNFEKMSPNSMRRFHISRPVNSETSSLLVKQTVDPHANT